MHIIVYAAVIVQRAACNVQHFILVSLQYFNRHWNALLLAFLFMTPPNKHLAQMSYNDAFFLPKTRQFNSSNTHSLPIWIILVSAGVCVSHSKVFFPLSNSGLPLLSSINNNCRVIVNVCICEI